MRRGFLRSTSPERQAAFAARIAMQQNAPDADSRYQAVIGSVTTRRRADDGPRALASREQLSGRPAQQLAAREHNFIYRPADPERFFDMLIQLAGDAARRPQLADVRTTSRARSTTLLPAGTNVADQPLGVRDNYTTLAWLGGNDRARPDEPPGQRDRDVRSLCAGRQVAPGPDQGQLLGRPRGARSRALPGGQRLFRARGGLSRAVLRPARARAARAVGATAARRRFRNM